MRKLVYYPGCTLRTKAKVLDETFKKTSERLGVDFKEMNVWNCCGAAFPYVTDNLINLVAPIRILARAREEGEKIVTLCAFCYNTLKRANHAIKEDAETREKLNLFLEEDFESEYKGEVETLHFLDYLRDEYGFENIPVENETGERVAPYYGCMLLRPGDEIGLDNPEAPRILEDFLRSIGYDPVHFPHRIKCCGSYLAVYSPDIADRISESIVSSAIDNGAETITTTCPLCHYNLEGAIKRRNLDISIRYFTELLGIALGL